MLTGPHHWTENNSRALRQSQLAGSPDDIWAAGMDDASIAEQRCPHRIVKLRIARRSATSFVRSDMVTVDLPLVWMRRPCAGCLEPGEPIVSTRQCSPTSDTVTMSLQCHHAARLGSRPPQRSMVRVTAHAKPLGVLIGAKAAKHRDGIYVPASVVKHLPLLIPCCQPQLPKA